MHTSESPPDNFRLLIRHASALCMLLHSLYIVLFYWTNVDALAALNVLSVGTHALAFWLARPHGHLRPATLLLAGEITVHAVVATVLIGWGTGFHYLMLPVIPVAMLSSHDHKAFKYTMAMCLSFIYLGLDGWSSQNPPVYALGHTLESLMRYQNIVTLLLTFIILSRGYYNVVTQAQAVLTRQASTDPLTGAINRRKLMEIGRTELARQPRQAQPIGLLLCDIDHFKRINDTLGHKAGDQVLQDFYRRALGVTRTSDSICRWGGEEFLILLPDTDALGTDHLAERLCQAISATPFKTGHTPPLQVTVTIGVATVQPNEGLLEAVHRADKALYQGKRQGRNQVVRSTPPAAHPTAAEPASHG